MNSQALEEHIEIIAASCHSVNRAWCLAHDDASQVPWENASSEIRASCISGVREALAGATPEHLHESWCRCKRDGGWTLGKVKNEANRTHPCLVPYGELPPHQRAKDSLFSGTVATMFEVLTTANTERKTTAELEA